MSDNSDLENVSLEDVLEAFAEFVDLVDEWEAAICWEPFDAKRTDIPDLIQAILDARETLKIAGYVEDSEGAESKK